VVGVVWLIGILSMIVLGVVLARQRKHGQEPVEPPHRWLLPGNRRRGR
jgi:hypothetical protein